MNATTNIGDGIPGHAAEAVSDLPNPPLSRRDLRDVGPGLSGMVVVPEDTEDPYRVRLYLTDTDVVARFEEGTETWTVESVESPDRTG